MLPLVLLFLFSSSRDWINAYETGDCGIRHSDLKDNEFPWHVALYKFDNTSRYTYLCGGIIIDTNVVLAAAHCVFDEAKKDLDNSTMVVAAGKHNSSWEHRDLHEQRFEVIRKIVPFTYRGIATRFQDDIALLALNDTIKFSSAVMPICLDRDGTFEPSEEIGTIVGWDANGIDVRDELQLYRMQPISYGECLNNVRRGFTQYLTSDKFCAIHKDGIMVKQGVNGGGLVFTRNQDGNETRYFIKGILTARDDSKTYAIFTNITNHIPWINSILITITAKTNASKVSSGRDRINNKEIGDCGLRYDKVAPSIAHGESSMYNEFPWHIALFKLNRTNKYEYKCGGSIIDTNVVITAADCVYDEANQDLDNSTMVVAAGKHNSSWEHRDVHEQRFEVIRKIVPFTYRGISTRYQGDIALLALNDSIKFSSAVMPVCLDRAGVFEPYEEIGTLIGWSLNESGVLSEELHEYQIQPLSFGECLNQVSKSYTSFLTSDKLCAVTKDGIEVKHGDGGGGLVFTRNLDGNETSPRYFIKGILSGRESDGKNLAVFTNITNHIPWINTNLKTITTETNASKVFRKA